MSDTHNFAKRIDGAQYRHEGDKALWDEMKTRGLVAVFGASDDLMEFRGAIYDEVGAYAGTAVPITPAGLIVNKCGNDDCPYHAAERTKAATIMAVWQDAEPCWSYQTDIPHATFTIYEDATPYCEGIVFALADVPALTP